MIRNISILGSTGSIGTQTLEVVDILNDVKVVALSTNKNIDLLIEQIKKYKPKKVVITDDKSYRDFKEKVKFIKTEKTKMPEILFGMDGLIEIATMNECNFVINSLVGNIGLIPTIEAIKNKKNIGLANKETLVTAGEIVMTLATEHKVDILPIDSEHSAIFQCLIGNKKQNLNKIYLTASGGPFRTWDYEKLKNVTPSDALKHPNWVMGKKITIDSSTLMNKGLEVIEAKRLFDVAPDEIEVVVHPESIIHSMVEYIDGSIIAQIGTADMRTPIAYSLTYPERASLPFKKLDLFQNNNLTFEKPNIENFKCLKLAYDALKSGSEYCSVLNAANEICVEYFLDNKIKFLDIPKLIENALSAYNLKPENTIESILEADKFGRRYVTETYGNYKNI